LIIFSSRFTAQVAQASGLLIANAIVGATFTATSISAYRNVSLLTETMRR
jgi:hypothetical protein